MSPIKVTERQKAQIARDQERVERAEEIFSLSQAVNSDVTNQELWGALTQKIEELPVRDTQHPLTRPFKQAIFILVNIVRDQAEEAVVENATVAICACVKDPDISQGAAREIFQRIGAVQQNARTRVIEYGAILGVGLKPQDQDALTTGAGRMHHLSRRFFDYKSTLQHPRGR